MLKWTYNQSVCYYQHTTHQSAIINKQPISLLLSANNSSVCYYHHTIHQSAIINKQPISLPLSRYNRIVYYNPYTSDQTIIIDTSVDIFHIPSFQFCYVYNDKTNSLIDCTRHFLPLEYIFFKLKLVWKHF